MSLFNYVTTAAFSSFHPGLPSLADVKVAHCQTAMTPLRIPFIEVVLEIGYSLLGSKTKHCFVLYFIEAEVVQVGSLE